MRFTRQNVEDYFNAQLPYKVPFIFTLIDRALDKGGTIDYYEGMLAIMLFFNLLEDKITKRYIFGGVQEIWIRNAALVVMAHLLTMYEDVDMFPEIDLDLDS